MELSVSTTLILILFLITFISDFLRGIFELVVNFHYRSANRPTVTLDCSEIAIVIPCHNSAEVIETTILSLPKDYPVYCVANNCSDDTPKIIKSLRKLRPGLQLIDVDYPEKDKTKAALLGAHQAKIEGFSHILLLDDDVSWPRDRPIEVLDKAVAVTGVPIIPQNPGVLIEGFQVFEYIATNMNKRCQTYFAEDVTWASGAAAIYRCDTFLEVMRMHDGEFAGEDVQCSYLHHEHGYKIDFLPRTVVATVIPRSPSEWWKQRSHSWDVSFMFLHIGLLLRVLFHFGSKGPGWWIRLLTFYRIYDSLLVFVKVGTPFAIAEVPAVALIFLATSYSVLIIQFLSYPVFFSPIYRHRHVGSIGLKRLALAFVLFPAYQFMTWVSRLNAIPKVIYLKWHPRPLLGEFIDKNFAACSRVDMSSFDSKFIKDNTEKKADVLDSMKA
jgi:cellulose synthase/poly-beta-1,6-N-acetylglucosamine synthase-like glycosyltransferase